MLRGELWKGYGTGRGGLASRRCAQPEGPACTGLTFWPMVYLSTGLLERPIATIEFFIVCHVQKAASEVARDEQMSEGE